METDMSPIDDSYDPEPPQRQAPFYQYQDEEYYQQPPQVPQPVYAPPPVYTPQPQKKGFFSDIDTTTWVIIGLLVLIAFFMGKTMQPVIIRN
jgi:hypothetical protein